MFKVGVPVFLGDFIDRKEELKTLKFYLTQCENQSVMLHAPRRFGKTSLIKESFRQIHPDNPYLLYFDFKHYSSLKHLSNDIIEQVYQIIGVNNFWDNFKNGVMSFLKQIKPKLNIKIYDALELSIEPVENFIQEKDEVLSFIQSIEVLQILAKKLNIQLKVAFDEFQDICILTNDKRIIDKLRSTVQHQQNVAYIFCGSVETLMNEFFLNKKSAFFHFSRIITLGPLDKKELKDYIIHKFSKINVKLDVVALENILDEINCHPYYAMKTMQILHGIIVMSNITLADSNVFEEALELAFQETKSYIEDIINHARNKSNHFEVLLNIAKNLPSNLDAMNNYRVRQSLVNMGLIKSRERGEYYIVDAFLKKYLESID